MSTLLNKKYCEEHEISSAELHSLSDNDEAIENPRLSSILSTVTNEDDSVDEDIVPMSDSPPPHHHAKSVRFDVDNVVTINADTIENGSEASHQYRDDRWYTVRSLVKTYLGKCLFVSLYHRFFL